MRSNESLIMRLNEIQCNPMKSTGDLTKSVNSDAHLFRGEADDEAKCVNAKSRS